MRHLPPSILGHMDLDAMACTPRGTACTAAAQLMAAPPYGLPSLAALSLICVFCGAQWVFKGWPIPFNPCHMLHCWDLPYLPAMSVLMQERNPEHPKPSTPRQTVAAAACISLDCWQGEPHTPRDHCCNLLHLE